MNDSDGTTVRKILREPLFQFLGIAALLFLANTLFSGSEREIISIDSSTQDYLIQQRQELLLRQLDEQEKREIIENYIEEEILVREARKRGFDNGSRIRTLLVQNMRYFMTSEVPEPSDAELRAFFEENIDRFEIKASLSYDHVFFSNAENLPEDTLARLRNGQAHESMGDTEPSNSVIYDADERTIVSVFGREQAPEILNLPDGDWHGPYHSASGVHFLRVAGRNPAQRPTWEQAQSWIANEWLSARQQETVDQELETMRKGYRIEVETADSTSK